MAEKDALPDPDQTAERVLTRASVTEMPVDVNKLAACWDNLNIVREAIDGPGYLLPLGRLGGEIIVNTNDPLERQRFTIAHELGHWILGRIWENKTGEFRQPPGIRHESLERWCDHFAASLLMPRRQILDRFSELKDPGLINRLMHAPVEFQVSEDAFFIRIWEVLCVQVAIIEWRGWRDQDPARVVRSWGDEKARSVLQSVLENRDLHNEMRAPFFFFTAHSGRSRLACSGKYVEHARGKVILALANISSDQSQRGNQDRVDPHHAELSGEL